MIMTIFIIITLLPFQLPAYCTACMAYMCVPRLSSKKTAVKALNLTGGHFACACVNALNDNSVGASNLMAGNRKLARKIPILLKAISLVL